MPGFGEIISAIFGIIIILIFLATLVPALSQIPNFNVGFFVAALVIMIIGVIAGLFKR